MKKIKSYVWLIPVSLMMASCVSNQKFMSAQNDIERLKQDSAMYVQAAREANERADELMQEKSRIETNLATTQKQLDKTSNALSESRDRAERIEQKLNFIADDLKMFNTSFSQVSVEEGHVKLVMDQAILFELGSSNINTQGDILLERLAATLKKVNDVEIAVEGHTDSTPIKGEEDNWDLSVDRSLAVIDKLTQEYGVSPKKLIAAGKSKFDPVVSNDNAENKAKNRRVEFLIIPDLESIESEID